MDRAVRWSNGTRGRYPQTTARMPGPRSDASAILCYVSDGQIKRFEAPRVGKRPWRESMESDPTGLFVYHSDYEKIREEREKLRGEQREAIAVDIDAGRL